MPDADGPMPLEAVLATERQEIDAIRRLRMRRIGERPVAPFNKGKKRDAAKPPIVPVAGREATAADEPPWQTDADDKPWVDAIENAHSANHVGLAFSGGGIRSATFNLGVLQALADLKLLFRVDYLSTVSGGGYIGAWLAAWTKRRLSFGEVQECLGTNRVHQEQDKEPSAIRFLRIFSNYLTPKLGFFSGDTWAMVGIYVRNLLLNLTIVLAMLAALLLVPHLAQRWVHMVQDYPSLGWYWFWTCAALLLLAFLSIVNNMAFLENRDQAGARQPTRQGWVLLLAGVPIFATAALGALWLVVRFHHRESRTPFPDGESAAIGAAAYLTIWLVANGAALIYRKWLANRVSSFAAWLDVLIGNKSSQEPVPAVPAAAPPAPAGPPDAANADGAAQPRHWGQFWIPLLGAIGAGALAGALYAVLSKIALYWTVSGTLAAGVPLVLGIFLLAGTLHLGLAGVTFPDRQREWWGRLGGWLILWGLVWAAIFWMALRFPDFIETNGYVNKTWAAIAKYCLTPAWILTTLGSVFAGKSNASGKPGTQTWKDVVAKVGPYVFIAGLLGWISWGIEKITRHSPVQPGPVTIPIFHLDLHPVDLVAQHVLWSAFIGCLLVAFVMSWRVDVNEFSMHMFYRNRLVRCYLGASNPTRSPNLFTGFDRTDDMPLKNLTASTAKDPYDGPYPILNASLNLVKGKDLAWQERKAESFVMTPKFCGYDVWLEEQDSPLLRGERPLSRAEAARREVQRNQCALTRFLQKLDRFGYRPTESYAFPPPFTGLHLGLAVGISGAAASPNMGSYSSPAVGFLMTIFNVRLGQWLGNPRHHRTWKSPSPGIGLQYLLNELFGGTNDEAAYVYLSDGGHFENMGLYELVKRRCGLIILCDAECDGSYRFTGLGNAIRKCRIDLGIEIDLDVSEITPEKDGAPSKSHCAIGDIHYETVDMNAPVGKIVYFKSSLTGNEPSDVKNYTKTCPQFPHETTANQWFTESQFESYRRLGYHAVMSSILPSNPDGRRHGTTPPSASEKVKDHLEEAVEAGAAAVREARKAIAGIVPDAVHKPKPKPLDKHLIEVLQSFGFDESVITELGK